MIKQFGKPPKEEIFREPWKAFSKRHVQFLLQIWQRLGQIRCNSLPNLLCTALNASLVFRVLENKNNAKEEEVLPSKGNKSKLTLL